MSILTMKKSLLLSIALFLFANVTFAWTSTDEGMFPPEQVLRLPLIKKGLKIRPLDIYNPKGGGLSEAVVSLSIGCTAEFVSPDGLILTNHHCGYDALVAASTPDRNYGEIGYKADSRSNELTAKDYQVFIPERTEDVTAKILSGTENLTGDALAQAIKKNTDDLLKTEKAKAPEGSTVRIQTLNNGYFYFLYQVKAIKDIRVVYAPPKSIGFFGGDPDNFEWTRHCGDFTFLRAYVAPDGKSAEYSPNNVPYKPKKFLTINAGGIKENDFVFVLGFPGGTTRYRESQSVEFSQNINFPFIVDYLTAQTSAYQEIGRDDEEKRVKLQGEIFNLNNSIKAFDGGVVAMKRANLVAQRRSEEAKFATWINADPTRRQKYGTVLSDFTKIYNDYYSISKHDRVLRTLPSVTVPASQVVLPVFKQLVDAVAAVKNGSALSDEKRAEILEVYKDREPLFEREMIQYFLKAMASLPANQKFPAAEKLFAQSTSKERRMVEEAFAASIAEKDFASPESVQALYGMKPAEFQSKYPKVFDFVDSLISEQAKIAERLQKFNAEANRLRLLYMKGMSEMKGVEPYPDANFTQRFSYGNVKSYKPREAVSYAPFTTLKGVLEKDTGVEPFNAPQKLKDLQRTKDFGRFGVGDSVPVNFLSTNDIIGGNSGSPVLNAYGEQVGLVFDGNYEGLGNDFFFSNEFGRTISVDIRYVLFVTEKFGNAGWILDELKIKSGRARAARR